MRQTGVWYSVSQKEGMVLEVFPQRSDAERCIEAKGEGRYEIKAMWATPGGRIFKEAIVCRDMTTEAQGSGKDTSFGDDLSLKTEKHMGNKADIVTAIRETVKEELTHQAAMIAEKIGRSKSPRNGERESWTPCFFPDNDRQQSFQAQSSDSRSCPERSWTPWRLQ